MGLNNYLKKTRLLVIFVHINDMTTTLSGGVMYGSTANIISQNTSTDNDLINRKI